MKKFLLGGIGLVALIAVPAVALQPAPQPGAAQHGRHAPATRAELQNGIKTMFDKADANRDGQVSKAEFDAAREARKAERGAKRDERRAERFTAMDADKNGQVSRQEYDAAHAERQQKWADAREAGKPGSDGKAEGRRWGRHGGHHRGPGMGFAMGGGRMGGEKWFEHADADKNGSVTLAEASAKPLERFDAIDTNKDGTISPEERQAAVKTFRDKRAAGKPARG